MSLTSYRAAPPRVIDEPTVDFCHMDRAWPARLFGLSVLRPFGPAVGRGCSCPRYFCDLFGLVSKAKGRFACGLFMGLRPLGL
jgi:hypothetical protein